MSRTKPMFLMAGGRPRDPSVMMRCLKCALDECEKEDPLVAYIGTASGDNLPFFTAFKALIKQAGAGKVEMIHLARRNADTLAAKTALRNADAIFISGGEVADGMDWLTLHHLTGFLGELYEAGKVFIGMSAGSIMMGAHWVRWEDEDDDSTASLFDCIGLVPATFDTHAEDEDWKELKTALRLMGPGSEGYGLPRDGMIMADRLGNLVSVEKEPLLFVNEGGTIRKVSP